MGLKGPTVFNGRGTHPIGMAQNLYGGAAMYFGVDYHKKYSIATKMNDKGKISERVRLNNNPQTLLRYAESLPKGSKIALEATDNWYYFYEILESRYVLIYTLLIH
jgi:hypothetical protein